MSILWLSISNGESHFRDIASRSVTDANPEPVMVEVKKKHSKDGINEPLEIIMEVFMYKITATIEKKVALLLTLN